jgi:tetratricopeptide (TPR) repeat protein
VSRERLAAVALAMVLVSCRGGRTPAASGSGGPADAYGETRHLAEAGDLDGALASLAGAPDEAEVLYLRGTLWARKAAVAPAPTPPPVASPAPRGLSPPAAPEFKPEEQTALDLLERAVSLRPEFAQAHLALAELLAPHALRHAAAATAARGSVGRHGPGATTVPALAGPDASVERVLREYQAATLGDRSGTAPVEALIAFSLRAGRLDAADTGFQELLRRQKENPEPIARYGDFLRDQVHDLDGAVGRYREALIWRPDDASLRTRIADIYLGLAEEHLNRQEYPFAEERLNEARKQIVDPASAQGRRYQELAVRLRGVRGR